jgi:hypothetical protein
MGGFPLQTQPQAWNPAFRNYLLNGWIVSGSKWDKEKPKNISKWDAEELGGNQRRMTVWKGWGRGRGQASSRRWAGARASITRGRQEGLAPGCAAQCLAPVKAQWQQWLGSGDKGVAWSPPHPTDHCLTHVTREGCWPDHVGRGICNILMASKIPMLEASFRLKHRSGSWVPVAHTCNLSYSGGRDQEDWDQEDWNLKPALGK